MISFSSHFKGTVLLFFFSPILPGERLVLWFPVQEENEHEGQDGDFLPTGFHVLNVLAARSLSSTPSFTSYIYDAPRPRVRSRDMGRHHPKPSPEAPSDLSSKGLAPASTNTGPVTSLRTDPYSLTVTFLVSDPYSMRARWASTARWSRGKLVQGPESLMWKPPASALLTISPDHVTEK